MCTVVRKVGEIQQPDEDKLEFIVRVRYVTEKVKIVKELELKVNNIFDAKKIKRGFKFILMVGNG
jgi:hypothetical protein